MEKETRDNAVESVKELKMLIREGKEKLGDEFEQTFIEVILTLLPEEVLSKIKGSWIGVVDYDENEVGVDGRSKVVIPVYLEPLFVLTEEGAGGDDSAYIAWVKDQENY